MKSVDELTDEQLRHIADSKDTGTCRARIRDALTASPAIAAETLKKVPREFCDFPHCDCSMGAAERCQHPHISTRP